LKVKNIFQIHLVLPKLVHRLFQKQLDLFGWFL
jgi:hypothetical protein